MVRAAWLALLLRACDGGAARCGPGDYSGCGAARAGNRTTERVAVLLSGLVRTFDIVHPRLRSELILPLEARGAVVDVFIQTSAASGCGIRDVQNDACVKRAFKGLGRAGPPDGAAVEAAAAPADAAAAAARLGAAMAAIAAPNLRFLDLSANATRERLLERLAIDDANDIDARGDLNSNFLKHGDERYKAHQYWRMDVAREAALAYARGDVGLYGAAARDWAPFTYDTMVWTRLDVLLTARRVHSNFISLDQEDKRHVDEAATFR